MSLEHEKLFVLLIVKIPGCESHAETEERPDMTDDPRRASGLLSIVAVKHPISLRAVIK